jgi:hypothetical protein
LIVKLVLMLALDALVLRAGLGQLLGEVLIVPFLVQQVLVHDPDFSFGLVVKVLELLDLVLKCKLHVILAVVLKLDRLNFLKITF